MRTKMRRRRDGARQWAATVLCMGAVLLALVGVAPDPVRAATVYYVGDTGDTSGVGAAACQMNSTANGCTLREAVALVNAGMGGDTIRFALAAGSTITLTSNEIVVNKGVSITGPTGGTITVRRDTANMTSFRILSIGGAAPTISNLTLSGGTGIGGGAILITNGSSVTLVNSTVSGNSATVGGGGAIYNDAGQSLTLVNSTVSGNTTTSNGGGIFNNGGTVALTNSTVSGNSADGDGGGIYNVNSGTVTLTNSTVSGNSGNNYGGGIYTNGTANVANTIIAGNTAMTNPDIFGSLTTNTNNLTTGNPQLAPLGSYGGPTQTMPPSGSSPAVDAGDAATCASTGATGVNSRDQRGVVRPRGAGCDIGAVEVVGPVASVVVDTLADIATPSLITCFDVTPGNCTLRDAIASVDAGGTVTFLSSLFSGGPGTITLAGAELLIDKDVTVVGPGANRLTIDANLQTRVLTVRGDIWSCAAAVGPSCPPAPARTRTSVGARTGRRGPTDAPNATATISGMTLTGGKEIEGDGGGARIIGGSRLVGDDLVVRDNSVSGNGGGIFVGSDSDFGDSTLTLTNATVSGNGAINGGGVANQGKGTALTNVTVSGNTAPFAGAVANGDSDFPGATMTLTNVTVSGNTSPDVRGAPVRTGRTAARVANAAAGAVTTASATTLTATNTIIAGNTGGDLSGTLAAGSTNNLVSTPMAPIDPLLAPLGGYGGTKQTQPPLPGSPAIDTGTNTGCPATDARGGTRPVNATCDIGAVESRGFALAITSGNNQTVQPNATFAPLVVTLTGNFVDMAMTVREPVQGGTATFGPAPMTGASAAITGSPATIQMNGQASVNAQANATPGPFTLPVAATGATNGVAFSLAIAAPNVAPTLDPIMNLTLPVNSPQQTVNLTGISAGAGDTGQTLTVMATSNTFLIPNPTVTYTSPNATGTLSFTPAAGQKGVATITVTVTDNGGTANGGMNTFSRTFTVTVNPATLSGLALTATGGTVAGAQTTIVAGGTVQLTPVASFSDGSMRIVAGTDWVSSDPTKGAVDANGRVTTFAPGTITVTTTYMGLNATFTVVITQPGTGGLVPNPAPVARPNGAAPATPPLPAPPTRAAGGNTGGIGPQAGGTPTATPRPAPPQR